MSNWATNTVDVFGKQDTGNVEFSRPTGLAVDKMVQLVVADDRGVFTTDGMFVARFGSLVLSNPYGLSVSNGGRIIVSDWDEDQLQIF